MKKILIATLVAVLALTGSVSLIAAAASVTTPGPVNLIADGGADGEKIDVGDLALSYDGTNLNVVFNTVDGWEMSETHLYVGNAAPPKSAPGKFPYKHEGLGWVTSDPYNITLSPATYCIAAQAEVRLQTGVDPDTGLPIYRYESLWAEGNRFGKGSNWAMCFAVTLLTNGTP